MKQDKKGHNMTKSNKTGQKVTKQDEFVGAYRGLGVWKKHIKKTIIRVPKNTYRIKESNFMTRF